MSTATMTPPTGSGTVGDTTQAPQVDLGPVVVATDGTTPADAAVRIAAQMTSRVKAQVRVLAVLPPAPLVAADYGILLPPVETESAREEALKSRVQVQLRELVGPEHGWSVSFRTGDPSTRIAAYAREAGARAIVLGLGHHDLLDRLFGGETTLHVLRQATVPIVAVPATGQALPTRVLVGTDFSPASVAAARTALRLFPGISIVYLAHVAPRLELQPEAYAAWMTEYSGGLEPAFARLRAELDVPPSVIVETITLTGKPSRALLDFARSAHVDAIVTGSRGAGFIDRMLVGSTASGLIRGAQTMLIAVPNRMTAPKGESMPAAGKDWTKVLADFSARNAGREAILEVDDPELGAQTVHRGYPFQGAAWDHHDRRVEIMMGELESTRHFTRGITGVHAVDVLRDASGADAVLRIGHGEGQTLLTLVR